MKYKSCPLTKQELENLYINECITIRELTKRFGVCKQTIWKWLEENNITRRNRIYTREDLSKSKFGYLQPIKYCHWSEYNTPKSKTMWLCKCDCGNERLVDSYDLRTNNIVSCGCKNGIALYNGVGNLSGTYYHTLVRGAKIRNLEFGVSKEFLWDLYIQQNGECALSGIKIELLKSYQPSKQTASLDRIDSTKGYIKGNVQWVYKDVNMMKGNRNEEYFIDLCKKIARKKDNK